MPDVDEELKWTIGTAMFGAKYYDYVLTPPTNPPGKYPSERAIQEFNSVMEKIGAYTAQKCKEARIDGMEAAKSRVLRRTEIPADAKNPTRDYVVILGEEIAGFIDADIAELNGSGRE